MEITSLDNQLVKKIASLHKKKFRDEYELFFIEGMKSIKEAINFNQEIEYILYSPDMVYYDLDIEGIEVSKEILCKISDTVTPQGIVAVCKIKDENIDILKGKKKIKSIISVLEYYDDRQEAYNTLEYLLDNELITEYKRYLF